MVLETDGCGGRIAGVWVKGMRVALNDVLIVMVMTDMADIDAVAFLLPRILQTLFQVRLTISLYVFFEGVRMTSGWGREVVEACLSISLGVSFGSSG